MAQADGGDTERDKAELYLENITDCVCEIISSLADGSADVVGDDEALILRNKGTTFRIYYVILLFFDS